MMDERAEQIQERLARRQRLPLTPTEVHDPGLTAEIESLGIPSLAKVGLHLWNDDLATSHKLVQSLEGDSTADYWHAIIHRREGDWSNAQYWFRRVGAHPVLTTVYGEDRSAAPAFVERCRRAAGGDPELEEIQRREMAALLVYALGHSDR